MPELVLRSKGACQIDPGHLVEVYGEQQRRFAARLAGFGPADWCGPSRCGAWSAHDVVRHICDVTEFGITAAPDDSRLDYAAGFDPRTSPLEWLAASPDEPPDSTLDRYTAISGELLALAGDRLAQDRSFDVRLPFGPVDWTVLVLHSFWDSWIHQRDVLLAAGAEHPSDDDATGYAIAYGVFLAATTAMMFGAPVRETLTLGGTGGGTVEVDNSDGVTVIVRSEVAAGPQAAEVADILAGRAQPAGVLAQTPAGSRPALLALADYFRTPAES